MTLPSKPVVIRLPAEANKRFEALCREFSGLPKSQVMRLLIEALLNEPLSEQVLVVTKQIRKPSAKTPAARKHADRLESLNSRPRH